MVQGQNPKLARGTVFFSQKFIFFFVLSVIHVQIKGSRLAQARFVDIDAKWKSLAASASGHPGCADAVLEAESENYYCDRVGWDDVKKTR